VKIGNSLALVLDRPMLERLKIDARTLSGALPAAAGAGS
jgi:hypothetical protein